MKSNNLLLDATFDVFKFLSLARVNQESQCWDFVKFSKSGYGYFRYKGRNINAHRVSYALFYGKAKKNLVIDHICMNKRCVNPDHLREVSVAINNVENSVSATAKNKAKSMCKNGHNLSFENVFLYTDKKDRKHRLCRECGRLSASKRYYKLRKEKKPKELLGFFKGTKSKVTGAYNDYVVIIRHKKKDYYFGRFKTPDEARAVFVVEYEKIKGVKPVLKVLSNEGLKND